ncbi:MAG: fimbria/pilus outer membrane usher protein, partial [Alphaproteobacteria bacterium]|nr:fimbria/pilus outer membrane usher protein [Alphaproteobacteria bacterium]
RFAGIHLARDFSTQPGFVTIPMPTIAGESEVASVVDVYVNNVLTGTRDVPAGPFSITDVPVVTGGGEVQLVVRDLLGRETTVRARYYSARRLLRRGLDDYSLEAGFLRRDFGRSSFDYGDPMASASYRYGFSDGLTGEVHGEISPDVRMGGVGASVAVANIGILNASTAFSHSERGTGGATRSGSRAGRRSSLMAVSPS